nr:MAG TPA: RRN7 Zinc-finger of RNA-polymerase I-specific TFIIB, Rrn7 [Caudoviricetes sp.]
MEETKGEREYCEWEEVISPVGFALFNTSCGKVRVSYSTGYDIYCNACGKKIKLIKKK